MGAQFCKCLDTPSTYTKPPLSPKPPLNGYTPPPDSKRRPEPVIGKRINLEDQFDSAASPDDGPRCKDGSRDMRFKANRGKDKYDSVARHDGPRCTDNYHGGGVGSLDMRFKVNRGKDKYND